MMDIHDILKQLPHRYPFLLVDRVLEIEKGVRIRALKNVTMNEPFFTGHFPHRPVMPWLRLRPCSPLTPWVKRLMTIRFITLLASMVLVSSGPWSQVISSFWKSNSTE